VVGVADGVIDGAAVAVAVLVGDAVARVVAVIVAVGPGVSSGLSMIIGKYTLLVSSVSGEVWAKVAGTVLDVMRLRQMRRGIAYWSQVGRCGWRCMGFLLII